MEEVPKDRYCSPIITLATRYAFYVELEPLEGLRTQFMFWHGDKMPRGLTILKGESETCVPVTRLFLRSFGGLWQRSKSSGE